MLEETQDTEEIIERVAALDIGKAELVACVRVPNPDKPGLRAQEITTYSTMTRSLLGMCDRLRELEVTRVVMEATSDYWKPVFYILEAKGLDPWQGVAQSRFRRSQRCQKVRPGCGLMSRPATLLVREVDFLMIYSHPIASDLPRGSKTASDQAKRLCVPPCGPGAGEQVDLHAPICRRGSWSSCNSGGRAVSDSRCG